MENAQGEAQATVDSGRDEEGEDYPRPTSDVTICVDDLAVEEVYRETGVCIHPPYKQIFAAEEGDVVCGLCGLVLAERCPWPPLVSSSSPTWGGKDEEKASDGDDDIQTGHRLGVRELLLDVCSNLSLFNAKVVIDKAVREFFSFLKLRGWKATSINRRKPYLAFFFYKSLNYEGIYRTQRTIAFLFQVSPKAILKAEKEVCRQTGEKPLFIAAQTLVASVCGWLDQHYSVAHCAGRIAERMERSHYGADPEAIVFWSVWSAAQEFHLKVNKERLGLLRHRGKVNESLIREVLAMETNPRKHLLRVASVEDIFASYFDKDYVRRTPEEKEKAGVYFDPETIAKELDEREAKFYEPPHDC